MKTIESLKQSILNKIALIKGFAINILNKLAEENAGFIGHTVAKIAEDILGLFGEIDTLTGNPNIAQYRVRKYTMDTNGNYGNPTEEIHSWIWDEEISVDTAELSVGFSYDKTYPGYYATGTINEDGSTVFDVYIKRNTYSLSLVVSDSLHPGYIIVDGETYEHTYVIPLLYEQSISIERYIPLCDGYTFNTWNQAVPSTMPASNVLLRATWTANIYTVSWNVDGVITTQTYEYTATIVPPQDPWKEGYTFAGWTPAVAQTMPYQNLNYTATFSVNSYELHILYVPWDYEEFDGMLPVGYVGQVEYNTFFSIPTPIEEGTIREHDYDVNGYYPDQDVAEGIMPANDGYTLVVTYYPKTYTVTWDVDGTLTTEQVVYNHWPVGIPDPTKDGYSFEGWYPYVNIQPAYDVTYTAMWRLVTSTCRIDVYTMSNSGAASEYVPVEVSEPGWYWYKNNYDIYIPVYIADVHDYDTTKQYYKQIGAYPDTSLWHQTLYIQGLPGETIDAEEIVINRNMINYEGQYFDTERSGYNPSGTLEIGQTLHLVIYIGRYYYTSRFIQQLDDDSGRNIPITITLLEEPTYWQQMLVPPSIPSVEHDIYILSQNWGVSFGDPMPAEDSTFIATYKRAYTIDFRLNGGTASYVWDYASYDFQSDTLTIMGIYNTPVPEITVTQAGWTFSGWTPSPPLTFIDNITDYEFTAGTIYHACWESQSQTETTMSVNMAIVFEDDISVYSYSRNFNVPEGKYTYTSELKLQNGMKCAMVTQNIRSGPGESYSVVGSLPQNSIVTPLEYQDNWARIDSNQWVLDTNLTDSYIYLFYNGVWKLDTLSVWTQFEQMVFSNILRAVMRKYPEFDPLSGYDLFLLPANLNENYIVSNRSILYISGTPMSSIPSSYVLPPFFLYMKKPDGTMVYIDSLS